MSSEYNGKKFARGATRGLLYSLLALSLTGCAAGPIAGAAVSLASGTLTAAADVTTSVVGTAVDVVTPDSSEEKSD